MSVNYSDLETPSGIIDGVNAEFALQASPYPPRSLILFKNGLLMRPGWLNDYTLDGNKIIYNVEQIPQEGDSHVCWYRWYLFPGFDLEPGFRLFEKDLTGLLTFYSTLSPESVSTTIANKALSGGLTFTGTLEADSSRGDVYHPKVTVKSLSGTLNFGGALGIVKIYQRQFSGGLTFGGALAKAPTPYAGIEKSIGGVLTFGGAMASDLMAVSLSFLSGITRLTVTTNAYREMLARQLIGASPRIPSHIAVGTGRILPTDAPILGQSRLGHVIIGVRNPGTYVKEAQQMRRLKHEIARTAISDSPWVGSAGVAHFSAIFTANEGTGWGPNAPREAMVWYEFGLFNKAQGGVMFARTELVEGVVKILGEVRVITVALRLE